MWLRRRQATVAFAALRIFMHDKIREATTLERLMFAFGLGKGFAVEGNSMRPALQNGDVVLIQANKAPEVGDVVVAQHPFKQSVRVTKRVARVDPAGYELRGDDPDESTDSRTFGLIERRLILGKVVCRLARGKVGGD